MTWKLRRSLNALSIKDYVIIWCGCIFLSFIALASGWLITEVRLRQAGDQRSLDIASLDTGRKLRDQMERAELLRRVQGEPAATAEAERCLLEAERLAGKLVQCGPTEADLRSIENIQRELGMLREGQGNPRDLRNAVDDYISLQLNDLAETNRVAQELHATEMRWWVAVILLVTVLLVLGSLGLILRVVRPVRELTRAAACFAAGDYSARARVMRDDEIGRLSRTLNSLAVDIANQMEQRRRTEEALEQRVKDRTAELTAANLALQGEVLDRSRAEIALRESRERLLLLMESSTDAMSLLDRDLLYRWALNPMPPRPIDDIIGKPLGSFLESRQDAEHLVLMARRVLETGQMARFELVRSIAGETRYFDSTYKPWCDAEGHIIGVACYAHDITDVKRAEERMRESEETIRALLNATTEPVVLVDTSERVLVANETSAQSLATTPDEMLGKRLFDYFSPQVAGERRARFGEAVRTGRAVRFEDERDGRWLDTTIYPVHDEQGRVTRVGLYARDITDRRRAEESARTAERTARAMLNATTDSVLLLDTGGNILALNDAAAQRFARRGESLLGQCLFDLFPPGLARSRKVHFEEAIRTGERVRFEDQREGRSYDITASPVHDAGGTVVSLAIFGRDVTQRREAEEALRRSEALFRAVTNNCPDAIFMKDRKGLVLLANPAALEIVGKPVGEVIGRSDQELHESAETARTISENDRRIMDNDRMEVVEEIVSNSSDRRIYSCNKAPYHDADGRVIGLVGVAHNITESRRIEEALRESEARFRSMFSEAPIGMALVSPEQCILQVNRAYSKFMGYSEPELIGKNILFVTHPDDRQGTLLVTRRMHEGGPRVEAYEKRYVRKDGQIVWGEVSVSVIRDADGRERYTIAQIVDVTERKRAEQALRESEETIRALLNATTDSVFLMDTAGTVLTTNEMAAKGWGKSVDELTGASCFDFMLPAAAELRKAYFSEAFRTGRPLHFEDEHRGRWYDSGVYPILDAQGKTARMAVFARDITERKRVEEALRESEERYRELFEASPIALIEEDWSCVRDRAEQLRTGGVADATAWFLSHPSEALDCFGRIQRLDANKAALRLFRAEGKPELLANLGRLGCEEGHGAIVGAVAALAAGNEFFEAETVFRTLFGEKRNLLVSVSAALGVEKPCSRYIASLSDVTDLRRAQQEAIEHRQAAQLQRMETLAVTGRLAAGVAHEINNPLQGILAQLSLLDGELPEAQRKGKRMKLINGGVHRIAEIVRNLLQLHRAPPKGEESCAVSAVIPNLTEWISSMAASQRIKLEVSVSPPDMTVPISANALMQVLLNLVLNAIDAMPTGGVMQIEARQTQEASVLRVSDTGVGVPLEHRSRLFSPFFTTKGPKGTGLGLSVTHSLVASSGGTIAANDREGGGMTFSIRFENQRPKI